MVGLECHDDQRLGSWHPAHRQIVTNHPDILRGWWTKILFILHSYGSIPFPHFLIRHTPSSHLDTLNIHTSLCEQNTHRPLSFKHSISIPHVLNRTDDTLAFPSYAKSYDQASNVHTYYLSRTHYSRIALGPMSITKHSISIHNRAHTILTFTV